VKKVKRVSKSDWLQAALCLLREEGVEAIKIERIARSLNISKSGFYCHFRNREDLRYQMIEHWAHEFTQVITGNPIFQEGTPHERLENIMFMIINDDLNLYDLEMKSWGKTDPAIAKRIRKVFKLRFDFIGDIFREMGFSGEDLEIRSRMFNCYHSWERTMFDNETKKKLKSYIPAKIDLLTKS
jgi:AcrR family transcriptional regulator